MHKVLAEIKTILDNTMPSNFGLKRIQIGTSDEDYAGLMLKGDFPAILISPNGEPEQSTGPWAGHMTVEYSIRFFVILANQIPNYSRVIKDTVLNQQKTLSEVSNKMREIFGNNKTLNGSVRAWATQWETKGMADEDGRQIRMIETNWINDLVPWDGRINNQTNIKTD